MGGGAGCSGRLHRRGGSLCRHGRPHPRTSRYEQTSLIIFFFFSMFMVSTFYNISLSHSTTTFSRNPFFFSSLYDSKDKYVVCFARKGFFFHEAPPWPPRGGQYIIVYNQMYIACLFETIMAHFGFFLSLAKAIPTDRNRLREVLAERFKALNRARGHTPTGLL